MSTKYSSNEFDPLKSRMITRRAVELIASTSVYKKSNLQFISFFLINYVYHHQEKKKKRFSQRLTVSPMVRRGNKLRSAASLLAAIGKHVKKIFINQLD